VPGSSVSLYTTTDCTGTAGTSLNRTIANGASVTVVYARGRSAAPSGGNPTNVTFTAQSTGSTDGTSTLKVYPLVRRGACNLTNGNATSRCAVSPPIPMKDITRSFLVFSSTGRPVTSGPTAIDASDQNVSCALDNTNADVEVVCTRGGSAQAMTVQYQVVSFGRDAASGFGVSVQRFVDVPTSTSSTTTTQAITAVDTSRSFILASSNYTAALNDGEGFPTVKFTSTGAAVTSVDIVSNTSTPMNRAVSFEVVTIGLSGAQVIHTNVNSPTAPGPSNNYVITTASTPTATTFALTMAQVVDAGGTTETMCRRRFNTKVATATTLTMHRGTTTQPAICTDANSTVTQLTTQRINFPGITMPNVGDVTFNNNSTASQNSSAFSAVQKDKAICFLQTQGPGGQASGESNFTATGQDADDTGPFHAMVDFNAGADRVVVTREVPGNTTSTFSPVVVQFDP
jgi:hypothetical protein